MIPKKIHYCWFGRGEMPELAKNCIESWKRLCPDYEIVEWNEDNFDINGNTYVKEAYEARKFAFVSDYVRLYAIYTQGGIYMDTDVETKKNLDEFLKHKAFMGFENKTSIGTGIIGCEKENSVVLRLLNGYSQRCFIKEDGTLDITTNVVTITKEFEKLGVQLNNEYQEIDGLAIYPQNVFCPKLSSWGKKEHKEHAYTIHYFDGSWKSEKTKKRESSWWWKNIITPLSNISHSIEKIGGKPYLWLKEKLWSPMVREKKK